MTDLGDIRQLLASDTVRVHYDKYKLLFLTAGILLYDIASVFSKKKKKKPDGMGNTIARYARAMTYTLHIP